MALVLDFLILRALGFAGDELFAAFCLASWPMAFLVTMVNMRMFPPDVEISGAFREILHPVDAQDPLRSADPMVFHVPVSTKELEDVGTRMLSWRPSWPTTFEGWGIFVVVVAEAMFLLYEIAAPLRRLFTRG